MRVFGTILGGIFLILGNLFAGKIALQTDWHQGPGAPGPVDDWDARFQASANINYLYEYGRLSLAAEVNPELQRHNIGDEPGYHIQSGDMDGDGDADVVVAGLWRGRIVWFENADGAGNFSSTPNLILYTGGWPEFNAADLDADSYTDLLTEDEVRVIWQRNNYDGSFTPSTVGYHSAGDASGVADFDADGDLDIVSTGRAWRPPLYWFENDGNFSFTRHQILSSYGGQASYVPTGDLNGDGYADFLISSDEDEHLEWWENDGSSPPGFIRHNIATAHRKSHHTAFTWLADMDKDGDEDVLATANLQNNLAWWENDGSGGFTRHDVSNSTQMAHGVVGLDVDYDGDVDIITASYAGDCLTWWENDGSMNFTPYDFGYPYDRAWAVWVDDFDANGFLDVASVTAGGGSITSVDWWDLFDRFASRGELTSSVYDAQIKAYWSRMECDGVPNPGGKIQFLVRTTNSLSDWPDWSECDTIEGSSDLTPYVEPYTRYLQYKVILSTTDQGYSPFLYEVRIIYFGGDIGVTGIISPPDTVYCKDQEYSYLPRVEVSNLYPGDVKSDEAQVVCGVDSAGMVIYEDNATVDEIGAGEDVLVEFSKPWIPAEPGNFIYKFFARTMMDFDQDANNDSLAKDVYCAPGDVAVFDALEESSSLRIVDAVVFYRLPGEEPGLLSVFDVSGRCVESRQVSNSGRLELNGLSRGAYFVRLEREACRTCRKLVLIR